MQTKQSSPNTAAIGHCGALYVSLELGLRKWLVTSLQSGSAKMSRREVTGGDLHGLLDLIAKAKAKAETASGGPVEVIVIQEVGMDAFWLHRALEKEGIESWLVDPASISVPRKRRRAKTDRIDGEVLLRTLMAFKRGEPRVCAMAVAPSPEEEDRRRIGRERQTLLRERVAETNRIKGILLTQGLRGVRPLDKDFREQLETMRTGDGRDLPRLLFSEINRILDRLELIRKQIAQVEAARAELAARAGESAPVNRLAHFRGIGETLSDVLGSEALYREFRNRRQIAGFAGLAGSPFKSGEIDREQGISKCGNARVRAAMIELAWLWLQWQPDSALSQWFLTRVNGQKGRIKRVMIVALARKLLIALWRYCRDGIVPEGARLKAGVGAAQQ